MLARILSQTAAHSHLEWDTLVDGEQWRLACAGCGLCRCRCPLRLQVHTPHCSSVWLHVAALLPVWLTRPPTRSPFTSQPAGATVQCGPETYCFSGKQLRALAHLMRRVGLVLWQQALLFPQVGLDVSAVGWTEVASLALLDAAARSGCKLGAASALHPANLPAELLPR